MKYSSGTILVLLAFAVFWARNADGSEKDDSWSTVLENAIGRKLSIDDAEQVDIEQLKDKTADAIGRSEDNSDENEEEIVNEGATLQDENVPNDIPNETTGAQDSIQNNELDHQYDSKAKKKCGGVLRGSFGRFSSPGFPFSYPKNIYCKWVIRLRKRGLVKITFEPFAVGSRSFLCRNDSVVVGGKKYCGTKKRLSVKVYGSRVSVTFRSGSKKTGRGFSAKYVISGSPSSVKPPKHSSGDLSRALLLVIKATRLQLQAVERIVSIRSKKSKRTYKREVSDLLKAKVNDTVKKLENRVDIFKHGPSTDSEKNAVDDEMKDINTRASFIISKLDTK